MSTTTKALEFPEWAWKLLAALGEAGLAQLVTAGTESASVPPEHRRLARDILAAGLPGWPAEQRVDAAIARAKAEKEKGGG